MPRATFIVELDIDQDGHYGSDITSDVISAAIFRGRDDFMDAAQVGTLSITLDNHLGKYAPKSPAVITENAVGLTTLVPIRVRTTSPVAIPHFTGFITSIEVDANPKSQSVTIEASDSMALLQRIIISRRMMVGQSTGLIIQRLLDAAEGELSTNPSFDVNLVTVSKGFEPPWGFVSFGAGDPLAMEDSGQVSLEGHRGIRMDTTDIAGVADGWEHALTKVGTADKISVAVYVKYYWPADNGRLLALRLVDDGGQRLQVAIYLSSIYQRIEGTAQFAGANPKLRVVGWISTSASAVITGAVHVAPLRNRIPRNVDAGDVSLSYYGPYRMSAMSAIDEVRDSDLGGLFYIDGGGTAVFERGSARVAEGTVSLGTVDETFWKMNYNESSEDRVSKVSLSYSKFEVGALATYIWELELPSSRLVPANGTEFISSDYGFFAKNQVRPVANTDYRLNSNAAGTGIDMTGTAYGTVDWFPYGMGSRAEIRIGATASYLTQYAIRAQPIRQSSDNQLVEYVPPNSSPAAPELEHEYLLNDNKNLITKWAQDLGDYADSQRESLSITIRPRTVAILQQMLSRQISDRVTLINNDKLYSSGVNGDYYIESIRHSIKKSGFLHETTWALTPI